MSYMYETVNASSFMDAFRKFDRFSGYGYDALDALFAHLEEVAEETGEPIELDVVALCCDWSAHSCARSAAKEYGYDDADADADDADADADADDADADAMEWLGDRTTVLPYRGGVLVQSF